MFVPPLQIIVGGLVTLLGSSAFYANLTLYGHRADAGFGGRRLTGIMVGVLWY